MLIGSIHVNEKAVTTHRDSYLLDKISVVSVRRPFLSGAVLFAIAGFAFSYSFNDLLFAGEIITTSGFSACAMIAGIQIGQLKLLSRDLRASPLGDAIWGHYGTLNAVRMQIAGKLQELDAGDVS